MAAGWRRGLDRRLWPPLVVERSGARGTSCFPLANAAAAADLPEMKVNAIGLNSKTIISFGDEVPFWTETIPEASGGKITVEFSPIDLAGIKDPQIMRMTTLGVTDFGAGDISKMAGGGPLFEGCDLAG